MPFGVEGLVLARIAALHLGTRDEDYGIFALTLAWVRDLAFLEIFRPR